MSDVGVEEGRVDSEQKRPGKRVVRVSGKNTLIITMNGKYVQAL